MEASYQAFTTESDDESDIGHSSTVKIHIPPTNRISRWSHIEDLDSFFTRIYLYHQRGGFVCILMRGLFDLFKVAYSVILCLFLMYFINYDVIFQDNASKNNVTGGIDVKKISISDAICSLQNCFPRISTLAWTCIVVVSIFWIFRLIKLLYNLYYFWDIKGFFNIALQFPDVELCNLTWHEVQKRVCEVQREQQMCIRKLDLTELDIYHRILRSKNYMVAMINKSVLPIHHYVPFVGSVCYLSHGLKYNIELLLFSGTWGFFENWNLKEDYKKQNKRHELAAKLQTTITWFAIGNLLFGVFIFAWQIVYFFFNYAEVLKREPGSLGLRCWSLYGRLYLRHFNELDHELDSRLRRSYRPASKYMNTFSSPALIIISQNVAFVAGSILAVLIVLTVIDEDVLLVEHVLTIMTVLGAVFALCRSAIPDENVYWCPESLLIDILAEVHYLPDNWRGLAHTTPVRDQFSQFFQFKAVELLHELISPIVTPLIFYFKLRPRSLEIIDFYRNFTVTVVGVGDVCSFSLMDTRKHGNPAWQTLGHQAATENNKQTQAEDGKTELSLIHFMSNNPTWHPPETAQHFIEGIKEQAEQHYDGAISNNKHSEALSSLTNELSMILSQYRDHCQPNQKTASKYGSPSFAKTSIRHSSIYFGHSNSMILSQRNDNKQQSWYKDPGSLNMSINALYLHSMHHRKLNKTKEDDNETKTVATTSSAVAGTATNAKQPSINTTTTSAMATPSTSSEIQVYEGTPLLRNISKTS